MIVFLILIFLSIVIAVDQPQSGGNENMLPQLPTTNSPQNQNNLNQTNQSQDNLPQNNQVQNNQPQNNQPFNMGLPQQSSADPSYVAEQIMIEGMTTAYNWVSLNTQRFSEGCKTDKDALIMEITDVLKSSQEAATACQRFELESKNCDPQVYCEKMRGGQMPLPSNINSALKEMGKDPTTMKAEDMTLDLINEVCIKQANDKLQERTKIYENAKEDLTTQLVAFRKKCEEYKQNSAANPNVKLPDFVGPTLQIQYAPGTGPNQVQQQNPNQPNPQQGQNNQNPGQNNLPREPNGPNGMVCNDSAPNCDGGPAPMCQNGKWICPQGPSVDQIITSNGNNGVQGTNDIAPAENGTGEGANDTTQESGASEETTETPTQESETSGGDSGTAQTSAGNTISNAINGFFVAFFEGTSVCGNGICEPDMGESPQSCSSDCKSNTYGNQPQNNQPQNYNQQQNPGRSPQQLCEMSDEEIFEEYLGHMKSDLTFESDRDKFRCTDDSIKTFGEINKYKLQTAMCKADAALDCDAKKQALTTCLELKDSPDKIATIVVTNVCRRIIAPEQAKNNKLYDLAAKFDQQDPALASQLSDTAETNQQDKKDLSIISYLFGDGGYAQKIKERTDSLRSIKERLVARGDTENTEIIALLDAQIKELEAETDKFSNAFDIFGRLTSMGN